MLRTLFLLVIFTVSLNIEASPHWRWEDRFSGTEKAHLQDWILHAEKGLTTLVGPLPYVYRVHFHRMTRGREPTPWAHTDKHRGRAVHFHVNTAYAWNTFKTDWTASHELSHLLFPYLGAGGMWFAEGLASYLQYQIMYANQTLTWKQAGNKLEERFRAGRGDRNFENMSIVNLSNMGSKRGAFVRLYWGGAAYFMNVDMALSEQKNIRLNDVITAYLQCCVYQDLNSPAAMIALFDRISKSDIFTRIHAQTVTQNGFPQTSEALDWLLENPPVLRMLLHESSAIRR